MAKRKQPSLTIDEAFQRLHLAMREKNGNTTCERLNTAMREDQIGVLIDGTKVKASFFATNLRVSVEETSGGGWTAEMTAIRALERPVNEFEWTVPASDVSRFEKSKPQPSRRRSGPVTTHDWIAISAEIAFRCRKEVPKSERKLAEDVLQWCEDTNDKSPAESEVRAAVKQVCDRFRRG
jgi:hypothetical protein